MSASQPQPLQSPFISRSPATSPIGGGWARGWFSPAGQPFQAYSADLRWDFQQQQVTSGELLQGLANRILHSTAYKAFYLSLAISSIICLILTFIEDCPSTMFKFLEIIINGSLVVEVAVRISAQGRRYFQYWANLIDLFIVVFCLITMGMLLTRECTVNVTEEMFDTLLLVLRNSMQFARLFQLMKKNSTTIGERQHFIDIEGGKTTGLSADFDQL